MVTETLSIASLTNTAGLSDLFHHLAEGKEIRWAVLSGGEPRVFVDEAMSKPDRDDIVLRQQTVIQPMLVTGPLRRNPQNHFALTNKRLGIVNRLWSIVLSKARQSGLDVSGEIGVEDGIEDRRSQVVLAVRVDGNANQALALWKALDMDVDGWLSRLPQYDQRVLMNDVGLRFSWTG